MFTVAGFFHRDLPFLALFLVDCGFVFLGGGEFCFVFLMFALIAINQTVTVLHTH